VSVQACLEVKLDGKLDDTPTQLGIRKSKALVGLLAGRVEVQIQIAVIGQERAQWVVEEVVRGEAKLESLVLRNVEVLEH
jgi:hypothetical protein